MRTTLSTISNETRHEVAQARKNKHNKLKYYSTLQKTRLAATDAHLVRNFNAPILAKYLTLKCFSIGSRLEGPNLESKSGSLSSRQC